MTLPPGESQHLARVLRLGPGDAVDVFDGRGLMMQGVVTLASASAATIGVVGPAVAQPEAPYPLGVCAALLKGDAMDAVIRDATVLGAVTIVPMTTRRTNVPIKRTDSGRLYDRWRRVAVAAAKQCGRARVPDIAEVCSFAEAVAHVEWQAWQRRVLVEPAAVAEGDDRAETSRTTIATGPLVIASGPEGGWAADEVAAAVEAGWVPWTLGPFTLRAEHVTLAALAVVRQAWYVNADVAG